MRDWRGWPPGPRSMRSASPLIGFSYGGMVSVYAAHEQVARAFSRPGLRFAGHAAFYAPCIAQFEDKQTTGSRC